MVCSSPCSAAVHNLRFPLTLDMGIFYTRECGATNKLPDSVLIGRHILDE